MRTVVCSSVVLIYRRGRHSIVYFILRCLVKHWFLSLWSTRCREVIITRSGVFDWLYRRL